VRVEIVCKCSAYKFPHRMMGGKCTGHTWVVEFWEQRYGSNECADCINFSNGVCEVVEEQEPPLQCPELVDMLAYEGVIKSKRR
jgi:hypothetical protein